MTLIETMPKIPIVVPAGMMVSLRATQKVSAVNVHTEARTSIQLPRKSTYLYIRDIPALSRRPDNLPSDLILYEGNRHWCIARGRSLHILTIMSDKNAPLKLNIMAE